MVATAKGDAVIAQVARNCAADAAVMALTVSLFCPPEVAVVRVKFSGEGVAVLVSVDGAADGAEGQGVRTLTTQNCAGEEVGSSTRSNSVVAGIGVDEAAGDGHASGVCKGVSALATLHGAVVVGVTPMVSAPC